MRHQRVALAMLIVGLFCSCAWYFVDGPHDADFWNIAGAAHTAFLLVIIGLVFRSWEVWAVVGILGAFKLMVIGCNAWWMAAPWPVKPGHGLCSTKLDLPLSAIGAAFGLLLAAKIARGNR
jgi:hypothetical protein